MATLLQSAPDKLEVWDTFCGGGGTSVGAEQVEDVNIAIALNHDEVALATHQMHFPNTLHELVDITKVKVRRYLKRSRPVLLWGSPECKYQGYSSGVRNPTMQLSLLEDDKQNPAHEQSRTTMNEMIRFAQEAQDYGYIIPYLPIENVPEVVRWHKFDEWEHDFRKLDYELQFVNLNARFLGVPQSRDRLFIVASHKRYPKPDFSFTPSAECDRCGRIQARQTWKKPGVRAGRYGAQYYYSCPHCLQPVLPPSPSAASVIDWSNLGTRIGDRAKPLDPKTIARIRQGLARFVLPRLRGKYSTGSGAHAQFPPLSFALQYYSRSNATSAINEPLPTVPCDNRHALVTAPFLMSYYTNGNVYSPNEPLRTVPCNDRYALIHPPQWDEIEMGDIDLNEMVQNCYTRMLTVEELRQAQGFPDDYTILGNDKQKKRQIGNAVPPAMAQFITSRIRDAIAA